MVVFPPCNLPGGQLRLYLTMVMSIAGALVSAFAVPLNPRDPTTVAVLSDGYIIPYTILCVVRSYDI